MDWVLMTTLNKRFKNVTKIFILNVETVLKGNAIQCIFIKYNDF